MTGRTAQILRQLFDDATRSNQKTSAYSVGITLNHIPMTENVPADEGSRIVHAVTTKLAVEEGSDQTRLRAKRGGR